MLADNIYENLGLSTVMGIDPHINSPLIKPHIGMVEPEVLCCIQKLLEIRQRRHELVEEFNLELLEAMSGDPTNKCFQESANTVEPEMVKVGEYDGCYDRNVRRLPLYLTVGDGGEKEDSKRLQLGPK